jgi:hypothetical protein
MNLTNAAEAEMPSIGESDCFCKLCEKYLDSKYHYRQHPIAVHNMALKPNIQLHEDTVDHPIDMNLYCKPCERLLSNKCHYAQHLLTTNHKLLVDMKKSTRSNQKPAILNQRSNDVSYCKLCEKNFSSQHSFCLHQDKVHQPTNESQPSSSSQTSTKNMSSSSSASGNTQDSTLPDVDDPNCYCKLCKRSFAENIIIVDTL